MRTEALATLTAFASKRVASGEIPKFVSAISALVKDVSAEEVKVIKSAVRLNIDALESGSTLKVFRSVSQLPQDDQIGLVAEILTHAIDLADSFSTDDALSLIKVCGRTRLFDSQLLNKFSKSLVHLNVEQFGRLLTDCNRLRFVFSDSEQVIFAQAIRMQDAIATAELKAAAVPLTDYYVRFLQANGSVESLVGITDIAMKCVENKIKILSDNPQLLQQRSVISMDAAFKAITGLGQISRLANCSVLRSQDHKDAIVFVLNKVMAYELRNLTLHQLLRLHFALSAMDVFDDFFIRRRLVPAIATVYKRIENRAHRDTTLVLTMVSQLPFTNPIVTEMTNIASEEAEKIKTDDVFYEAVQDALSKIRST